ncbi:MAG: hypothetical protein P1P90_03405 [Patescibacteria group bacterium]|nr:hypothetical protein [Patescibacteria group bacterium]
MKKLFALICLLSLGLPSGLRATPSWQDKSSQIPETVLDTHINIPYISFVKSRGNDWLAGNPNQLFHVMPDRILDLTPDLQSFGMSDIRQIATDGSGWLIIGDQKTWQTKPDIVMHYDGKYWNNVSQIIRTIPASEWIGEIAGKQGIWYIVTDKNLYAWHSALSESAVISLPESFREPRTSAIGISPVANGWILNFEQKNGPKSIAMGRDIMDRRFFFFDGLNFQELTSLFGNISNHSTIGTNGSNILVLGAYIDTDKIIYNAYLSDGVNVTNVSGHIKDLIPDFIPVNSQYFLNQAKITWSGNSWIFTNSTKKLAVWNQNQKPKLLPDSETNILDVGYGKNGSVLMSGYKSKDKITPSLTFFQP